MVQSEVRNTFLPDSSWLVCNDTINCKCNGKLIWNQSWRTDGYQHTMTTDWLFTSPSYSPQRCLWISTGERLGSPLSSEVHTLTNTKHTLAEKLSLRLTGHWLWLNGLNGWLVCRLVCNVPRLGGRGNRGEVRGSGGFCLAIVCWESW